MAGEPNIRHPGRHRACEVTLIRDPWQKEDWIPGQARNGVDFLWTGMYVVKANNKVKSHKYLPTAKSCQCPAGQALNARFHPPPTHRV